MAMPSTYYDLVCEVRPFVRDLAEQDARDLLASAIPPETIGSVDDYDSRFKECLKRVDDELFEQFASLAGESVEDIRSEYEEMQLVGSPQFIALYHSVNYEYHCLVNFALAGKKAFHFSDNLAEHLAHTEVNLKCEFIQLPFPTCLFSFPSRTVINAIHNIRADAGRRAMNDAALDYTAPVSVFLTIRPAGDDLPGRKLVVCAWHAGFPNNHYLALKRELYLNDDWTLEQALRTDWQALLPDTGGEGLRIDTPSLTISGQDDEAFYTDGFAFMRIVLNAVLYLSSDEADRTPTSSRRPEIEKMAKDAASPNKRRKLVKKARLYSILDHEEVGLSIGPIVINKSETDVGTSSGGSKPLVRFMVRGHWRNQAHGTGRQARKLIWIRPFFKGPDLATAVNKPYLVK